MFVNGGFELLYIKLNGDWLPFACLTDNSFSESTEMISTTTRDNNGWSTSSPTNQSYDISFSGLATYELQIVGKLTLWDLKKYKKNRTLIEWRIGLNNYKYGSGYIVDLPEEYPVDDNVSFSGSIIGFGIYYDYVEVLFDNHKARVIADGGTVESESCLINFINSVK